MASGRRRLASLRLPPWPWAPWKLLCLGAQAGREKQSVTSVWGPYQFLGEPASHGDWERSEGSRDTEGSFNMTLLCRAAKDSPGSGPVLPPGGGGPSRKVFGISPLWRGLALGIWWGEAKEAARHPAVCAVHPTTKHRGALGGEHPGRDAPLHGTTDLTVVPSLSSQNLQGPFPFRGLCWDQS